MARHATLWQRGRDGMYMTTMDGRQVKLSKNKAEARRLFHQLMGGGRAAPAACPFSVRKLCDTYLDRTAGRKTARRTELLARYLQRFCDAFGHRRPETLKPHEVNDWLDGLESRAKPRPRRPGGPKPEPKPLAGSSKALIVTMVKAVFNWAATEGYVASSPLAKLTRRKIARRERVLTPDEYRRVAAAAAPGFRDFLTVLAMTGCRPFSEAARLTAADIDFGKGRTVFARHKNAGKGKIRVVYYPPAVLARLRELAAERPTGPLLVNARGTAWDEDNVSHYLRTVADRAGIERFPCYALRTTYISAALARGVPVETVAALCGNSPKVIHAHYNSVDKMEDVLRAAAEKAVT